MSRLPRVTAQDIIRAIERKGFALIRQSGSHKIYKNSQGVRITVPFHSAKILHPKLLKAIMQDADLTESELN
jgi:predicted RNA binding protein YcfA (HicA-like mRNA interferase family)